jgi:hypothetical protein
MSTRSLARSLSGGCFFLFIRPYLLNYKIAIGLVCVHKIRFHPTKNTLSSVALC